MAVKVIQMLHVRGSGLRSQGRTWKSCFEGSIAGYSPESLLGCRHTFRLIASRRTPGLACQPRTHHLRSGPKSNRDQQLSRSKEEDE